MELTRAEALRQLQKKVDQAGMLPDPVAPAGLAAATALAGASLPAMDTTSATTVAPADSTHPKMVTAPAQAHQTGPAGAPAPAPGEVLVVTASAQPPATAAQPVEIPIAAAPKEPPITAVPVEPPIVPPIVAAPVEAAPAEPLVTAAPACAPVAAGPAPVPVPPARISASFQIHAIQPSCPRSITAPVA